MIGAHASKYGNLTKTDHRHRAWEALADLVPLEWKNEGWVLALAAASFEDRKLALRYGFRNVIGVDFDGEVAAHNAAHGRCVVNLPLSLALRAWRSDRPVCAVWADFCSNMSSQPAQQAVCDWMSLANCIGACLFLNLQKGREQSNEFKILRQGNGGFVAPVEQHRARALFVLAAKVQAAKEDIISVVGRDVFNAYGPEVRKMAADCGERCAAQPVHDQFCDLERKHCQRAEQYTARKVPMNWAIYSPFRWPRDVTLVDAMRRREQYSNDDSEIAAARRHIAAKLARDTGRRVVSP